VGIGHNPARVFSQLQRRVAIVLAAITAFARRCTAPCPNAGPVRGLLTDLLRSKRALVAENAMLRQQLQVAMRSVKRPALRCRDRVLLAPLASIVPSWREILTVVKPETILRWHRQGFRLFWRRKSRRHARPSSRIGEDVVALIKRIARENHLWGAERIRGELLKLGIRVAKSTIQRYIRQVRKGEPPGQRWSTFLRNQAHGIWCCDLFEVRDLFFRAHYVFAVMHLGSRRILRLVTTREPTAAWLAQQMRKLTPFGEGPHFLIRDNDSKFGQVFDSVVRGAGTQVIRTPVMTPVANSHCERMIGSVRRECTDHILILGEAHLQRLLAEYATYFTESRPHQGIGQRRPGASDKPACGDRGSFPVRARPILGGLHHTYSAAA
jgi:hypothetical protein